MSDALNPLDTHGHQVAPQGSLLACALLFVPEEEKDAIRLIRSFQHELHHVAIGTRETEAARTRLAWWGEEISRIRHGSAAHPIGTSLVSLTALYSLNMNYFADVLLACQCDLEQIRYKVPDELKEYCDRFEGSVAKLVAQILCDEQPGTDVLNAVGGIGRAMRMTDIIRDFRNHIALGRIYLPDEWLADYGLENSTLREPENERRAATLLKRLRGVALDEFDTAEKILREHRRSGLGMFAALTGLYRRMLDNINKYEYAGDEQDIAIGSTRQLWIAWRAARKFG